MKFLIVFACALAAASAGNLLTPVYPEQHLPVIGPNGVPVDTAAVQQATAEHLAHKVEAQVRNGDLTVAPVVQHPLGLESLAYTHYPFTQYSGLLHRARRGVVAYSSGYHHAPVVATSAYSYPYVHSPAVLYRKRRGVVAPVAYTAGYHHTPVVTGATYSYPYTHSPAVLYRKRRGVVAPVAYTAGYHHSPVVATSAYSYPYVHKSAVLYRKRRGIVAPVAYTSGYHQTPVVSHHSVYSAFPYLHHY